MELKPCLFISNPLFGKLWKEFFEFYSVKKENFKDALEHTLKYKVKDLDKDVHVLDLEFSVYEKENLLKWFLK